MKKTLKTSLMITLLLSLCAVDATARKNPLLETWKTPFQTPPFEKIQNSDFKPAFSKALEEARKNIQKIVTNKTTPTFDNTIIAYSQSSALLTKVSGVFFNLDECNTNPEMQAIALEMAPEMARFSNEVSMNEELFKKIKAVYDKKETLNLTGEQNMLLEKTYQSFIRNGALLSNTDKERLKPINEKLSTLELQFSQNVLADKNAWSLHLTNPNDLNGLPKGLFEAAGELAKSRNLEGWLITLDAPSCMPFLQYADRRSLREKVWRALNKVGNQGNEYDNNEIVDKISALRARKAQLLGYKTYAEYVLSLRMAENPETVNKFLNDLLDVAMPYAQKDLKAVEEYAKSRGFSEPLQRWDWAYYAEKLKNQKYSVNQEMLRPYFQLENVRNGIFSLFGQLYNLQFNPRKDISAYHPDVEVYEVYDTELKKTMGILYLDFFPRESKRGGAWMTAFREQSVEDGNDIRPLIQIVCNFTKPTATRPSLLTFDEFETFLHEFGHAIHGLLSQVNYEELSGTSVYRDFVELPSQVMENWALQRPFLDMVAKHYQTQEPLPQEYVNNMIESQRFNAGYTCVRQLGFAFLDMAWHSITTPIASGSVERFERSATAKTELFPIVDSCILSTSFSHIFAGGYAAGYYGYKWAEVLDADVFSVFLQNGIFDKKTAKEFREKILSKGGTEHPMKLYKDFRGQTPDITPLLKRSGFIQDSDKK